MKVKPYPAGLIQLIIIIITSHNKLLPFHSPLAPLFVA